MGCLLGGRVRHWPCSCPGLGQTEKRSCLPNTHICLCLAGYSTMAQRPVSVEAGFTFCSSLSLSELGSSLLLGGVGWSSRKKGFRSLLGKHRARDHSYRIPAFPSWGWFLFLTLVMVPPTHCQLQISVGSAPGVGCGYQQSMVLHLPTQHKDP